MSPADSPFAPLPAPGPHPATAELRAYAAGTLAPADEHRIEAHTLDCERCADLVEGFSMSDAATTDHAVAELRTRLQARLGTAETIEPVATRWAWPRLAAAAALLGVAGGGFWAWDKHDTASLPTVARVETAPPSAASAPKPALPPSSTLGAEVAAASEATKDTAKATAKPAEYAAVSPAQSARRQPFARQTKPVIQADENVADRAELADMVAATSPAPEPMRVEGEAKAPAASTPAPSDDASYGYSSPAAAPAKRGQGLVSGRAAADTLAVAQDFVARRTMKAKAMAAPAPTVAEAAPAIVPNTPMPVTPSINAAPVIGSTAFREYLRREAAAFEPEINNLRLSGTVRIRFIVGADGKLSNLKVARGLRQDYDDEALRIVCDGPAWQPGIAGGKRAPLPMEVTVPF